MTNSRRLRAFLAPLLLLTLCIGGLALTVQLDFLEIHYVANEGVLLQFRSFW